MLSARCCIEIGEHSFVQALFLDVEFGYKNVINDESLQSSAVLPSILLQDQKELMFF
jgi:hypothetical protein